MNEGKWKHLGNISPRKNNMTIYFYEYLLNKKTTINILQTLNKGN